MVSNLERTCTNINIYVCYILGVSVAVSVFTLVSISLERYFAICQPLRSRRWQTLSHSYRMIAAVWLLSLLVAVPIAVYQKLVKLRFGLHKCVEIWNNQKMEQVYTIFLDLVLLVFPLLLMLAAYGKITYTLYKGMKLELRSAQGMYRLRYSFVDETKFISIIVLYTSGSVSL